MPNNIIAVSGEKHTGKTTLITRLLPHLTAGGLRVAVIKHDGHSFSADVPDTDSWKYLQSGAYGSAVFDGEKSMVTRLVPTDETALMAAFPEAELLLLEGFKESAYPKLFIHHDGRVTCTFADKVFSRDDIEAMAETILAYLKGGCANA